MELKFLRGKINVRLQFLITGVVVLGIALGGYLAPKTPYSSDRIIRQYMKQHGIDDYSIIERQWAYTCCAQSIPSTSQKANLVRYHVQENQLQGQQEYIIIDLYDTRTEAQQMDELYFGIGGHQHWQIRNVVSPEIEPSPLYFTK
jgi:hypothetical protein